MVHALYVHVVARKCQLSEVRLPSNMNVTYQLVNELAQSLYGAVTEIKYEKDFLVLSPDIASTIYLPLNCCLHVPGSLGKASASTFTYLMEEGGRLLSKRLVQPCRTNQTFFMGHER